MLPDAVLLPTQLPCPFEVWLRMCHKRLPWLRCYAPLLQGAAAPAAKGPNEAGGSGAVSKAALVGLAQPGIARLVIDEEGPEPIAEVGRGLVMWVELM